MKQFKHRRQDLPHMLQAVGGSKPWVSRSLRPWGVSLRAEHITFSWGGRERKCPISKRRHYPRPKVEFRGGQCVRMSLSKFTLVLQALRRHRSSQSRPVPMPVDSNTKNKPPVIVGLEWTTFRDEFDFVVPTKLVIEGIRLLDRWALDSQGDWYSSSRGKWYCKTDRRLWAKRHKNWDRKRYRQKQGSHLRWTSEAQRLGK